MANDKDILQFVENSVILDLYEISFYQVKFISCGHQMQDT